MRLRPALLSIALAACLDPAPPDTETVAQESTFRPVIGELKVAGCTPPPTDVVITAVESTPTPEGSQAPVPQPLRALVLPTQVAHQYAIVFPLLKAHTRYAVSAVMVTAHCPQVAWQGPHGGWLVPGETPLHVTAYAMRTQTEMLATRGPNHTPTWVGVDAIDIDTAGGAIRDLRWRTDLPNAVAGRVEVAADPFPVALDDQQQDPPLLASWQVPLAQQGWSTVPAVDFAAPLLPPPCDVQQYPNGCPTQLTKLGVLHRAVQAGAPIYARIVPVDASGTRLSGHIANGIASLVKVVHVHVPLDLAPPPPTPALLIDGLFYSPSVPEHASGYNRGCYTVNTPHLLPTSWDPSDYWGSMLATKYPKGTTIPVGVNWCFSHSSGTLDDIVNAISGLVDAFGDLVNEISKLYADIKKAAVKAVASAIDELHIGDCDSLCQEALMTGLDAALAAVGMPPSLPNFDELADRGLDYLEDVAAEESGVPEAFLDEARSIAAQAIHDMKSHQGLPDAPWLTPDDGFRPPQLQMFVRRDASSTGTLPGVLRFSSGTTYYGADVLLPRELPTTDGKLITVQLLPNFSGIPAPSCTPYSYLDGFGHWGSICIPLSDGEKQLYYEDHWYWNTLFTACDSMTALEFGVGNFGDGSLIYTPLVGLGVAWAFKPNTSQSIGSGVGNTCH